MAAAPRCVDAHSVPRSLAGILSFRLNMIKTHHRETSTASYECFRGGGSRGTSSGLLYTKCSFLSTRTVTEPRRRGQS